MKLTSRLNLLIAVLVVLGLGALAGCGSDTVKKPQLIKGATSGGKLTIGIDSDKPGIGLKKGSTYEGFDVETATYVAGALGVKPADITWVPVTPADRATVLQQDKADLVFAAYSITDQRKQQVDFAGPYFVAHQDLLIRRNDTDITGPKSLDGKVLCAASGTTSADYIKQHYKGDIALKEYPQDSDCVKALEAGDVDAVSTDDVILAGFAASSAYKGKLKVLGHGFTDEKYGVGIKKGDTAMVAKVNTALKQYVDSGAWKQALDKWVGPSGYKIPSPPTPGSD